MTNKKLTFRTQIIDNSYFSIPFFAFMIYGLIIQLVSTKSDIILYFNSNQNDYLDRLFIFMTEIGDGTYFGIALIFALLVKVRYTLLGLVTYLASGAVVQILKKYIFDEPRPKLYFEGKVALNYINGVDVHLYNSFPSGHAVSGFTIFLFLSIITKNKKYGIIYFVLALLVALSRVYLLQHFFLDIYFGSLIGFVCTIYIYNIIENSQSIANSNWYNYSILDKIRKKST